MDDSGWAKIQDLIQLSHKQGRTFTKETIEEVVKTNEKKRFAISEDGLCIRASQGHSIEVDLNLKPQNPPAILYHGTALKNIGSIFSIGIEKRGRQHVHLSKDQVTAHKVGTRHGKPVILKVQAEEMAKDGHQFLLSENGVWLVDYSPSEFIEQ